MSTGALLRECVVPARESGQLLLARGDETLLDHVRFITAPGRMTPGGRRADRAQATGRP